MWLFRIWTIKGEPTLEMVAGHRKPALMKQRHPHREVGIDAMGCILTVLGVLEKAATELHRRLEIAADEEELHLLPLDAKAFGCVADALAEVPGLAIDRLDLHRSITA